MLLPLVVPSRDEALAFVCTRGRPCLQRDLGGVARPLGGLLAPRHQVQLIHGYLLSPALGCDLGTSVPEKGRLKPMRDYLRHFHNANADEFFTLRLYIDF